MLHTWYLFLKQTLLVLASMVFLKAQCKRNPLKKAEKPLLSPVCSSDPAKQPQVVKQNPLKKAMDLFVSRMVQAKKSQWIANHPMIKAASGQNRAGTQIVVMSRDARNRVCVLLGKERGGMYQGKFNFIGGKVEQKKHLKDWGKTCI